MCDVDDNRHKQAEKMSTYMETIHIHDPVDSQDNIYEKEKKDYVRCLNYSTHYNPDFIVLVEDDGIPKPEFFPMLEHLLVKRIPHIEPFGYVKLFHPNRVNRYKTLDT